MFYGSWKFLDDSGEQDHTAMREGKDTITSMPSGTSDDRCDGYVGIDA
jgi:hypothetical protein